MKYSLAEFAAWSLVSPNYKLQSSNIGNIGNNGREDGHNGPQPFVLKLWPRGHLIIRNCFWYNCSLWLSPLNPNILDPCDEAIKKQSVGGNCNLKCECCEAILTQIWSRAEKVNRAIVGRMSNNMHCWANVGHCWANAMLANQTGRLWDLRGPLSRREEIWQKSSYDLALTFSI